MNGNKARAIRKLCIAKKTTKAVYRKVKKMYTRGYATLNYND